MRFWVGAYTPDAGSAEGVGILQAGAVDAPDAGGPLEPSGVARQAGGEPAAEHGAAHVAGTDHEQPHQASPCVSISAAASASLGVLPPHSTNWNTG